MYKNPYSKIAPKSLKPYTEIFFIRHGHPDYSLEHAVGDMAMPLSPAGRKQRDYLTKKLLTLGIHKIYASELKRAQETGEKFARLSHHRIEIEPRLNEIDWQDWHKVKYFQVSEQSRRKILKNHRRLNDQLDKMQVVARRVIHDIFRHNRGKRVAVFTHGNFIRAFLTGVLDADVIGFLSLEIFQSSISKVVIDKRGYLKIASINDVSHLPAPPLEDLFITLAD